jgi:hypothetical protein
MVPWYKHKTTQTCIAGMLTAAAGYITGEIGLPALIGAIFVGLAGIFAREGIEKSGPGKPQQSDDRGVELK